MLDLLPKSSLHCLDVPLNENAFDAHLEAVVI